MEGIIRGTLFVQILFILPYIMLHEVYGVQGTCPPLSCLSNSFYVRLGDMKTELEQKIIDQEIIKNQTEVIANQIDIIENLNETITDLKASIEEQKQKQNDTITELTAFHKKQEQINIQFELLAIDVKNKSRGKYSCTKPK